MNNNPIGLMEGGKELEFCTLQEFYLKVLELLWTDFPRGYIDYMLFMHDHTSLHNKALKQCCKKMEQYWDESRKFYVQVHWTYRLQALDRLEDLVRKMSRHSTNSDFDVRQFGVAWNRFCNKYLDETR